MNTILIILTANELYDRMHKNMVSQHHLNEDKLNLPPSGNICGHSVYDSTIR